MDKKDFSNLGDDIWYTVQDAFNTMDFTRLKEEIKYTAENTFNEVKRNFNMNNNEPRESFDYTQDRSHYTQDGFGNNQGVQSYNRTELEIAKKPAGSVSGVLYMVFGFLGSGVFGILLIVHGVLNLLFSTFTTLNAITFGSLFLLFGSSLLTGLKGVKLRKRVSRFKRYVRQLGSRSFCTIRELASHIGESDKFVAKDLRKMIDLGMFPQGHIDEQKTCLLLNNEIYGQYLKAMESMKNREQAEINRKQEELNKKKAEEERFMDPTNKDLKEAILSGRNYIRQIREANDAIPGEEISRKLDRLEKITEKIFNYVEKHPEQLPEIHKLMNYYLPITLKLVNTYKDLDAQPVQGANIITAKSEIEDTLDTISIAYEKLLDDLFHDIAFDISTDISMLETMLSKEGLTDNGFKK